MARRLAPRVRRSPKGVLERAADHLRRPAVWVVGVVVAVITVLATNLDPLLALPLGAGLATLGSAVIMVKDRVWRLGNKVVIQREPLSRRRVLSMLLAVSLVSAVIGIAAAFLSSSMESGYNEKVRRYLRRQQRPTTP